MYESRKMLVHQTARPADVSRMSQGVAPVCERVKRFQSGIQMQINTHNVAVLFMSFRAGSRVTSSTSFQN